jgi:hypothetical protein
VSVCARGSLGDGGNDSFCTETDKSRPRKRATVQVLIRSDALPVGPLARVDNFVPTRSRIINRLHFGAIRKQMHTAQR